MIHGKYCFDQQVKNDVRTYEHMITFEKLQQVEGVITQ